MKTKRIWAMMGAVYVFLSFLLITYWIATTTLITGITGIVLFPAAAALSAQFFNRSWIVKHGRAGHEEEPDFVEPEEPLPGWEKYMPAASFLAPWLFSSWPAASSKFWLSGEAAK